MMEILSLCLFVDGGVEVRRTVQDERTWEEIENPENFNVVIKFEKEMFFFSWKEDFSQIVLSWLSS